VENGEMMQRQNFELSVGVLVLAGLIAVAYLAVNLGELEVFGKEYYHVKARFQSVSGLKKGATVEISGVSVGKVAAIELDKENMAAMVTLRVQSDIELTDDTIASVRSTGLIGDKYIKVSPGGSEVVLKEGDLITETESAVDIEELIGKYVFGGVK
jgi:phospholipid/cholesterol/gamma-HCH transport system substrate-binding protein